MREQGSSDKEESIGARLHNLGDLQRLHNLGDIQRQDLKEDKGSTKNGLCLPCANAFLCNCASPVQTRFCATLLRPAMCREVTQVQVSVKRKQQ